MTDLLFWDEVKNPETPGTFGVVVTKEGETVVPPVPLDLAMRICAALNATRHVPLEHLRQIELNPKNMAEEGACLH